MEVISLIVGIFSIIIGLYAIWFAQKESKQTTENYNKTKYLLKEIEHKTEVIDRSVKQQEGNMYALINRILDMADKPRITPEEIDAILNNTKMLVEIPNSKGGKTAIIDTYSNIGKAIEKEVESDLSDVEHMLNEI